MNTPMLTWQLLGVPLAAVNEEACVEHVMASLENGAGGWIVTPNADVLRAIEGDPGVRSITDGADIFVADGAPLVWLSRIMGRPLPARVSGSDLVWSLSRAAAKRGRRLFLLGGSPGTAEQAADVLHRTHGHSVRPGTHCPPYGFESSDVEWDRIRDAILESEPDVVFVAMGHPKQDRVIMQCRRFAPEAWWVGVGGSFDFVSGTTRRAPLWMRRAGLEWLHRLVLDPRRLVQRYLLDDLPFVCGLLAYATWHRLTVGAGDLPQRGS